MTMLRIAMIASILCIVAAFAALVYAFIKKKPVGRWIALFAVTLLLPLIATMTLGESRGTLNKDEEEVFVAPVLGEDGVYKAQKGEYMVGEHIEPGKYDFTVTDKFSELSLRTEEPATNVYGRIGLLGIKQFRLDLKDGDKVVFFDESILTPVTTELLPFQEGEFSAGIYYVGEDISPGNYNISATTDTTGQVTIYDGVENRVVIEGNIGKNQDPPSADIELLDGEIIKVLDANFKLLPINN